jgi:frataxin-like iron-binding protein CyaY
MNQIDYLIGKIVLADLDSYAVSGKLISARGDDLTLQTRSGSRILINRHETRAIRELSTKEGIKHRHRAIQCLL